MKLTIEPLRGVWRCQIDSRTEFADTLEELLLKIAPGAPEEYTWHTAEVLGAILGAEVVELETNSDPDFLGIYEAIFGERDENEPWDPGGASMAEMLAAAAADPEGKTLEGVGFRWEPTEAQKAYFDQKPSLVDELLQERKEEAARENEVDAEAEGV